MGIKQLEINMKRQFSNADSTETSAIFRGIQHIAEVKEVREEPKRVNPFEHIDAGNKILQEARMQAAVVSDPTQTLVRGPVEVSSETVSLEELPALVRQAAEASIIRNFGLLRKSTTKTKNQVKR